jgi:hypothetical protein
MARHSPIEKGSFLAEPENAAVCGSAFHSATVSRILAKTWLGLNGLLM